MPHPEAGRAGHHGGDLDEILSDANHLLTYAVEAGIEVDADVAQRIITATQKGASPWDGPEAGALLAAITKLASKLLPVTAETLRACREEARDTIRSYKIFVYVLAAVIIPFSMLSFIYTGITNTINSQIKNANELVLNLHTTLSSPPDKLSGLQQLAVRARAIQGRANQLNVLNIAGPKFTDVLELPGDLSVIKPAEIDAQIPSLTIEYQKRRLYATNVLDTTSIFFGAVSASVLPVLYALLGACAAVLRTFTQQIEKKTFSHSYASPARFIIAAIGGGVIGLFNITIGEGLSVSPLALAFLVGYSTDVFFSFLEGSVPNVTRQKAPY